MIFISNTLRISKVLGDLARVEALLVGSGEIGRMTARALVAQGIRALRVTSRTEEHARALAEEFAARVVPFADVLQAAAACDLVISSTAAPGVIFEKAALAPLLRRRADRPLVIIDLAVPRDVASDVAGIDNVFLHDLDDLEAVLAQSRLQRACELPRCELIIDEEVQKFLAMHAFRREIEPVIRRLVDTVEIWQRAEVEGAVAALEPAAAEAVRAVVRRLTRRVLLFPINRLKALRDRGALAPETLAVLREIFEANADADDQDRHAR